MRFEPRTSDPYNPGDKDLTIALCEREREAQT